MYKMAYVQYVHTHTYISYKLAIFNQLRGLNQIIIIMEFGGNSSKMYSNPSLGLCLV